MSMHGRFFGREAPPPPIGIDGAKPVENPELSAAMVQFAREPSVEGERALVFQLQHARYLLPLLTEQTAVPAGREFTEASPELSGGMTVGACMSPEGAPHLPLFTDWPVLRAWADQQGGMAHTISALVLPANDVWSFALSQPQYAGVFVFSSEVSVPLPRSLIERLRNEQ